MMYRVMIIDDEADVIEGISCTVDWQAYGISICGYAENGRDALAQIPALKPDLLIVDVTMPIMSGIELLENLRMQGIYIPFIILSGHGEFAYAQKALALGAADYLLKPSMPEDILGAVQKARGETEKQKSRDRLLLYYQDQFQNSLPILRERILTRLLEGNPSPEEITAEKLRQYNILVAGRELRVILFKTGAPFPENLSMNIAGQEALCLAMLDIVRTLLQESHYQAEAWALMEYVAVILISNTGPAWHQQLQSHLLEWKDKLTEALRMVITIGVSNPAAELTELSRCYRECRYVIEAANFLGDSRVVFYGDSQAKKPADNDYPVEHELDILHCLRFQNGEGLTAKLEAFYNSLTRAHSTKYLLQRASTVLIGSVYRYCHEESIPLPGSPLDAEQLFLAIDQCKTVVELKATLGGFLSQLVESIQKQSKKNRLIEEAISYIKANYAEDIRLEAVAQHICITPGYLSVLFRQVVGIRFVDFWHQYRIQMAKAMLQDVRRKVYDVAFMVGYKDEKYFSQMFRKTTGTSPRQYRQSQAALHSKK